MKYTKQYIAVIPGKGLGKSLQEAAAAWSSLYNIRNMVAHEVD